MLVLLLSNAQDKDLARYQRIMEELAAELDKVSVEIPEAHG